MKKKKKGKKRKKEKEAPYSVPMSSRNIYIYVSLIRRKTSPIFLSSFFRLFTRAAE